jgi:mono/diheme cytochrome c family protein
MFTAMHPCGIAMRIFRTCITAIAISSLASACGDGKPDPAQLASGEKVYLQHCATCHGTKLEGQPNWRARLPNGRMPAPPHDDSGHTWHHPDNVLFGITKHGLVPPYAPPGYQSDMPGFAGKLSDEEIRAVLAYIASHWSSEVRKARTAILQDRPRR